MPDPTHITVSAPSGRRTPIHTSDGAEPGGGQLYAEPGWVCRVRYSQTVRRALDRNDLFACTMDGAPVTVTLAAAPTDLPGGKVAIAPDVRKATP